MDGAPGSLRRARGGARHYLVDIIVQEVVPDVPVCCASVSEVAGSEAKGNGSGTSALFIQRLCYYMMDGVGCSRPDWLFSSWCSVSAVDVAVVAETKAVDMFLLTLLSCVLQLLLL